MYSSTKESDEGVQQELRVIGRNGLRDSGKSSADGFEIILEEIRHPRGLTIIRSGHGAMNKRVMQRGRRTG